MAWRPPSTSSGGVGGADCDPLAWRAFDGTGFCTTALAPNGLGRRFPSCLRSEATLDQTHVVLSHLSSHSGIEFLSGQTLIQHQVPKVPKTCRRHQTACRRKPRTFKELCSCAAKLYKGQDCNPQSEEHHGEASQSLKEEKLLSGRRLQKPHQHISRSFTRQCSIQFRHVLSTDGALSSTCSDLCHIPPGSTADLVKGNFMERQSRIKPLWAAFTRGLQLLVSPAGPGTEIAEDLRGHKERG